MPKRGGRRGGKSGKGKNKRKQNGSQSRNSATEQKHDSPSSKKQTATRKVPRQKQPPVYVGIDIGSSYCKVALVQQPSSAPSANGSATTRKAFDPNFPPNMIRIVADDSGNHAIPAVVTWSDPKQILIGFEGVAAAPKHSRQCVFYPKTLCEYNVVMNEDNDNMAHRLFTRWRDFASHGGFKSSVRVENEEKCPGRLVFDIELPYDENDDEVRVESHEMIDALSIVLSQVKQVLSGQTQSQNVFAVVSIPVWYNEEQKNMLKEVLHSCGFQVKAMIPDCSAIALAYNLDIPSPSRGGAHITSPSIQSFLILDLATFTSTATILSSRDGLLEMVAYSINTDLCGREIDRVVMNHCINIFERRMRMEVGGNRKAKLKLRNEVEKVKAVLSMKQQATVYIESFVEGEPLTLDLSRARFEMLCQSILKELVNLMNNVLEKASMTRENIAGVCLAGGLSSIPRVKKLVTDYFGREDVVAEPSSNSSPQFVNAYGCALQAVCIQRSMPHQIPIENMEIPLVNETLRITLVGWKPGESHHILDIFTIEAGTCLPLELTRTLEKQSRFDEFDDIAADIRFGCETEEKRGVGIPLPIETVDQLRFVVTMSTDEFSLKMGRSLVYEVNFDEDDASDAEESE